MNLSLHTAQASDNASSLSTRSPPLAVGSTWTLLRQCRLPRCFRWRRPHQQGSLRPRRQICVAPCAVWLTVHARRHQREVCPLSGGVATPIRPITGRLLLPPSSSTRSPIGLPCGSLSLTGGLRAYHVASRKPRGLGPAPTPVARHPRRVSSEHPDLATHLLVQACQHLWLVLV
jgi:hypothetical protein